eukprot:CAMPEP_0171822192 /NCGR_PEP_ID=MMETSP0992-20121227/3733_1 /TAXON_ID=483369 /ORGANISM="non described non described, Strain CCMP2098" /LENGTH=147 /DNA_ID=CAMNT_0012436761 /DNA_START=90 /DNA_END=532 /DNA_ORIENTATION=-
MIIVDDVFVVASEVGVSVLAKKPCEVPGESSFVRIGVLLFKLGVRIRPESAKNSAPSGPAKILKKIQRRAHIPVVVVAVTRAPLESTASELPKNEDDGEERGGDSNGDSNGDDTDSMLDGGGVVLTGDISTGGGCVTVVAAAAAAAA